MSKVFAKTTAGTVKEVEATTVQDAANALGLEGNYTAVVFFIFFLLFSQGWYRERKYSI